MRKLLLTLFFSIFIFLFFSFDAKSAFAITTYHSSIWDNTAGRVPVTVSYSIKNGLNQTVINRSFSLAAGAWTNDQPTETAYTPPYTLTWGTECSDPTIDPVASSDLTGGIWVVAYDRQYVQCPLPDNLTGSCVNGQFNLSWRAGPSATNYAMRIKNNSTGIEEVSSTIGNVTSYNYTPQQLGVNYSWWLHGINDYGWS